jgi:serine/threonine protein kinase
MKRPESVRFVREAKAAAALNHPNIAHVCEIGGGTDGTHFIAHEFVEGETLGERIHRDKTALRKRLKYLAEVAGLGKAHQSPGRVKSAAALARWQLHFTPRLIS